MTTTTISLSGNPKRHRRERVVKRIFWASAAVSVLISAAIVMSLIGRATTFFVEVDKSSLVDIGWFPRRGLYDLLTPLAGTVVVSLLAMFVAVPLGLGAAIYLSEFARPRVRRFLKPILEVLAGIPSVVIGFFALTWLSPNLVQRVFDSAGIFSMLAASIGVGILITPLIASVSEDALRAVPTSLREAAFGLGAKRSETVRKVVFPAAISGIVASMILGLSRAIGETMVMFMVGGAVGGGIRELNPLRPGTTMTAAIASVATGSDQVVGEGLTFESVFALGFLLFVFTLVLNTVSDRFVRRARERY
ncbi:MAG: phosphate ABC transporter permease subunit PstC [Acidimicrobiia bacterium]|nr:phosphate ABC transporter permease subunit PstC [Acidimicrobiia bacterium]